MKKLSLLSVIESHVIDNGISKKEAEPLAKKVHIKQSHVPFDAFMKGANHEIEHKKEVNNSPLKISQIAMDHLREDPEYYEKIDQIEEAVVAKKPTSEDFFEFGSAMQKVNSPGTSKEKSKSKKFVDFGKIKNRSKK